MMAPVFAMRPERSEVEEAIQILHHRVNFDCLTLQRGS
jgi:hypothetical protein